MAPAVVLIEEPCPNVSYVVYVHGSFGNRLTANGGDDVF